MMAQPLPFRKRTDPLSTTEPVVPVITSPPDAIVRVTLTPLSELTKGVQGELPKPAPTRNEHKKADEVAQKVSPTSGML
jgi:hypothetical protein